MAKKLSTTPKGIAVYPHLLVPDVKFDKDGVYHTKLKLSGAEAKAFKKAIDDGIADSYKETEKVLLAKLQENTKDAAAKKAVKGLKRADPPYTENEDGTIDFSFKMKATGKKKDTKEPFTRKPVLFDRAAVPITDNIKLGGGSTIRVSYNMMPFYTALVGAGVSLQMASVQVINLVEWGADASRYGFEDESEEGEGETAPAGAAATKEADDDGDEKDDEEF